MLLVAKTLELFKQLNKDNGFVSEEICRAFTREDVSNKLSKRNGKPHPDVDLIDLLMFLTSEKYHIKKQDFEGVVESIPWSSDVQLQEYQQTCQTLQWDTTFHTNRFVP